MSDGADDKDKVYYKCLVQRKSFTIFRTKKKYIQMTLEVYLMYGKDTFIGFEKKSYDMFISKSRFFDIVFCNRVLTIGIHRGEYDEGVDGC